MGRSNESIRPYIVAKSEKRKKKAKREGAPDPRTKDVPQLCWVPDRRVRRVRYADWIGPVSSPNVVLVPPPERFAWSP